MALMASSIWVTTSGGNVTSYGGKSSTSLFFFSVPENASITPKWKSWRTRDKAQLLDAVCLFDPASLATIFLPKMTKDQLYLGSFKNIHLFKKKLVKN